MPKASTSDYRIKKIEKGPLQRFKNQNLLIKKFGEVGLQIYKAITGKRTTKELRKDLGIEQKMFDEVLGYMQAAGMVELEPVAREKAPREEEAPPEEELIPEEAPPLEELPPEEELVEEEETPPLEEEHREEEEEIKPMGAEEAEEEIKAVEEEIEKEKPEEGIVFEEEPEEAAAEEKEAKEEEEEAPIEEEEPEEEISAIAEEEAYEEESGLSPVEKIISDKYGDIGLQVYSLIDGQRTAEEIMRETGLSEQKLVEILDFMDEQGIIKLDYPKGGAEAKRPPIGAPVTERPPAAKKKEEAFVPMLEEEKKLEEARGVSSPVNLPIKAPLDIVKTVQMKAKMMLKFGDKGGKILVLMDGKNDMVEMALKLDMPLYQVSDIISYMLENGMAMVKPLTRSDVRQKYGDDGYSVYKKYGKEGLMLYELIGKELTIKQMADKVTKDRAQVIDMFIFIHQVLGIELPIDKKILAKELGL